MLSQSRRRALPQVIQFSLSSGRKSPGICFGGFTSGPPDEWISCC